MAYIINKFESSSRLEAMVKQSVSKYSKYVDTVISMSSRSAKTCAYKLSYWQFVGVLHFGHVFQVR